MSDPTTCTPSASMVVAGPGGGGGVTVTTCVMTFVTGLAWTVTVWVTTMVLTALVAPLVVLRFAVALPMAAAKMTARIPPVIQGQRRGFLGAETGGGNGCVGW